MSQDPDFSKVETTTLALLEFLAPMVRDIQEVLVADGIEREGYSSKVRNPRQIHMEDVSFALKIEVALIKTCAFSWL